MNGVINVLKPPGMTSHDVVSYIRKVCGIKKVGHTGTLDPGAAGVLPVCIGKSTKIVDYIMKDTKIYICELTLGNVTDTYDKYGEFQYSVNNECPVINEMQFLEILGEFTGVISQKPPSFSAIKINGKRAYEIARQGIQVDIPPRKVTIYKIDLVKFSREKIMLKITCSKGTYIRSICHDIGNVLGCGAYMSFLIRSNTGRFSLDNSYTLNEISKENVETLLVSPDACLDMEGVSVPVKYKENLLNGNSIVYNNEDKADDQFVKIYLENQEFIGIGRVNNNILYVEKLLV